MLYGSLCCRIRSPLYTIICDCSLHFLPETNFPTMVMIDTTISTRAVTQHLPMPLQGRLHKIHVICQRYDFSKLYYGVAYTYTVIQHKLSQTVYVIYILFLIIIIIMKLSRYLFNSTKNMIPTYLNILFNRLKDMSF